MQEQILSAYSDLSKMEQLEMERQTTMVSEGYQQWMSELNVSRSYVEPDGFIRAKEMNNQYDYSNLQPKSSFLNFLKIKGIWS
jgi:hypothetical protein